MVALVCIILGMGMPIPAAYVLTATLAVPALLELDFPLMSSHLFIVYFSAVSAITPPVAVAAYAAAGISGGNPNSTGFQAIRLAIAAYLVPIIFMYRPGLLLHGSIPEIVWTIVTSVIAVGALASTLEGYFWHRMGSHPLKILTVGGAFALIWSGIWTDLLGLSLLAGLLCVQLWRRQDKRGNGKNPLLKANRNIAEP
jgi:TRAP-type uncharacterized transport system fused permease subunit